MPQVEGLRTQLAALQGQGQVESFTYVSKDDALVELRERLKDPSILEELPSNPLPAKFNIKPVDPENAQGIIDQISDSPAIDQELGISYGAETADRLLSVARFIQWAGLGLITILLVASILLIGNTIRLSIFARRREVEVMKLVGATNWFIRWPFVIEGIICGLVGAILSVALLWAVKIGVVNQWIQDADSALTRDRPPPSGSRCCGGPDRRGWPRRRARQRHHAAPFPEGLTETHRDPGRAPGGGLPSEGLSRGPFR